jgi:HD-GYP domain-containing protein (c-di-GMP phosphodiesterase class II)
VTGVQTCALPISYRKKLSPAAALKEIQKASGTQFDPGVVAALLKLQESGTLAGML